MPLVVPQQFPCDVCRLLDNDNSLKDCVYCNLCDAYICVSDITNWLRRARAAVKRRLEPDYKGEPDYSTGNPEIDKEAGLI
jgi:hypothetical protein